MDYIVLFAVDVIIQRNQEITGKFSNLVGVLFGVAIMYTVTFQITKVETISFRRTKVKTHYSSELCFDFSNYVLIFLLFETASELMLNHVAY